MQRLRDRIKQQEGATARVQEMLQGLESRLNAPETAYPTLVFYQLRELWALGRTVLTQFAAELSEQQEERERRAFLAEYNRRQFDRRRGIDANLRLAEGRASDARNAVAEIEQRMQSLRAFWHYFKRRALRQRLQEANLQALLCAQDLDGVRNSMRKRRRNSRGFRSKRGARSISRWSATRRSCATGWCPRRCWSRRAWRLDGASRRAMITAIACVARE